MLARDDDDSVPRECHNQVIPDVFYSRSKAHSETPRATIENIEATWAKRHTWRALEHIIDKGTTCPTYVRQKLH